MKNFRIAFFDGFNEVRDIDSGDVIFSIKLPTDLAQELGYSDMNNEVVDNVVSTWNKVGNITALGSEGALDQYLLDEGNFSQEEREIITEGLYNYATN